MVKKFKLKIKGADDVLIQVYENGTINITGLKVPTDKDGKPLRPAQCVFKIYRNYRSNDIVVRSGSGLCGVYKYNRKKGILKKYIENDTMHSTTVEEIAWAIFRMFPDLFTEQEQKRIIWLIRYHDLGEKTDKPDDGSTPHDVKFKKELRRFVRKIRYLPIEEQKVLISDFIVFENGGEKQWDTEQKRMMQFAKLCDKLDGPFGAFIYELQGRKGSLRFKKKHFGGITKQDKKYAKEIGEYSQAGVWTAHMLDTYRDYEFIELFTELVAEASRETRGEVFPWLRGFCERRGMFNAETLDRICS